MVRFIHTADWQLGMTRHFLDADAQPRFSGARVDVVRTIGDLAVERGCAFVLVCGDVFETNHVERQIVVRAFDAMAATPTVTFYLLPGNHDPLDAASVFRSPTFVEHCPSNVVVLDGTGPVEAAPGLQLVGAPWRSKRPLTDLVSSALTEAPPAGFQRVVAGHGAVDHLSPDDASPALIRVADLDDAVASGRVHYVALGDRHSTTSVGKSGRIWYSGAPEATDFRETDPGNVLLVDLDADQPRVEICSVGRWKFVRHDAELTGDADLDLLEAFLEDLPDKDRTIVRLGLVGQLCLTEKARLDSVLAHHSDRLASLQGWERRIDLLVLPDDADFGGLELAGFAQEGLDDLRQIAASGGDGATTAQDALGLLLRMVGSSS